MTAVSISLLKHPMHWLGLGLGSGLFPKAPGTAGSLLAWVLAWIFPELTNIWFVLIASVIGIYICHWSAKDMGVHDHPAIVWDEFCGQWLLLSYVVSIVGTPEIGMNASFWSWLAAFLLFRFFDILKPWPISWLDKNLSSGFGIMLDDIMAALMGIAVIYSAFLVLS
jgi:phosphatidylglycerophosphatase A